MNKLIEAAKEHKFYRRYKQGTQDEIELALAWLKSEIRLASVQAALKEIAGKQNAQSWLPSALRQAYEEGKLKIVDTK